MKILQLLRLVPKKDLQTAKKVNLFDVKVGKNEITTVTKTLDKKDGLNITRNQRQRIYAANPSYKGKLSDCPEIKVTCSCERFMYYYETALHKVGAADLIHSNGKKPEHTNPTMIPGLCKHLTKALLFIKKADI